MNHSAGKHDRGPLFFTLFSFRLVRSRSTGSIFVYKIPYRRAHAWSRPSWSREQRYLAYKFNLSSKYSNSMENITGKRSDPVRKIINIAQKTRQHCYTKLGKAK